MPINLQALKTELVSNPAAMPYLSLTAENDEANANILNNVSDQNSRTVNRDSISTADFLAQTTYAAFDALTASEEAWYRTLTAAENIAVTTDTLATWAAVGGASLWATAHKTTMEPRIRGLMQYQCSRAEEIRTTLGASFVTPSDIANARQLP